MRLRAHLNGEPGEPPDEWIIGRICEEFGCLPSQAVHEIEEMDADLVFAIIDMRSYAHAKATVDSAKKHSDLKMTPAIRRVFEIEIEAMKQEAE